MAKTMLFKFKGTQQSHHQYYKNTYIIIELLYTFNLYQLL